jgi:hypothetical protein
MTTENQGSEPVALSSSAIGKVAEMSTLQMTMAMAGWTVDFVDIDLTQSTPMALIRCHRDDGLWFSARVDSLGRCSFETFQRNAWLGKPNNTKGRWPQSPQSDDQFLGRSRPADPQALLSHVASYIVDNAIGPAEVPQILGLWRNVIGTSPTLIE